MQNLSEKKIAWIAITGTIASGKSTVCQILKDKGYPVFDCDAINRELMQPQNVGYLKVVEAFGDSILNEKGEIDFKQLAHLIFNRPQAKHQVEQMMHPLILNQLQKEKEKNRTLSFVEVPLLFEVGWESYFDASWCVVVDDEVVIQRALQRGMHEEDVKKRFQHQMPSQIKRKKSSVVIENNGDEQELLKRVEKELETLCQMNKNTKSSE